MGSNKTKNITKPGCSPTIYPIYRVNSEFLIKTPYLHSINQILPSTKLLYLVRKQHAAEVNSDALTKQYVSCFVIINEKRKLLTSGKRKKTTKSVMFSDFS